KIHMNATSKSILDEPDFFISCDHCNHQGMPDKTVDDALANWREQIDFLVMRVGRLTRKWGSQLLPQETGA
ncbi:MAG: hypothetical protein P4M13_02555, partial [Alphaproteobacteria bacterium]|nr:hypothetical protein [Alphaproteobacteria bacterium]